MRASDRQSAGDWSMVGNRPRARGGHASKHGHDYQYGNPPQPTPPPGYAADPCAGHIPSPATVTRHTTPVIATGAPQ
ncbi:hypothetical protein SALBM311S_02837 [Streptomyces alboniger]